MMRPVLLAFVLLLSRCDQSMQVQHRAEPNRTTDAWASGAVARPVPEGTVARGAGAYLAALHDPPRATPALLARGRERYDIFCSACHGYTGDGDGMVVQRGYPRPPSLLSPQVRAESARRIVDAISNGKGTMFSYAAQLAPHDRWAIAAYIRALQLQQRAAGPAENIP